MIYFICAVFTAISAFVSFGFSIDALMKAKRIEKSTMTNAMYAVSRSGALALVSLGSFTYYSISYLAAISIVMIIVQAMDAIIGMKIKNSFKTYGPLLTALGNLVCFFWLIY